MSAMMEYILSVVCTASLCGIIMLLFDKDMPITGVLKLVLGIVMTVSVLKPILQEDIFSYDLSYDVFYEDASAAVSEGSNLAWTAQREIITRDIQTYIINKAQSLGANLSAEVELGENNLPESICMSGYISPYAKKQLEEDLITQLGVRKECLSWQ